MTAHKIVAIGDVQGTDGESVYVGFDVESGQRMDVASLIAEEVDLSAVPEHKEIGQAYKLENGDVAVHVPDWAVAEYGH